VASYGRLREKHFVYVLLPALFTWPAAGSGHRATTGCPKNDRFLISQMSTMYEVGLEPNLHLPTLCSRTDRSRQATYKGKPQRKIINDRKSLN
jgi:hypothetical protein